MSRVFESYLDSLADVPIQTVATGPVAVMASLEAASREELDSDYT